MTVKYFLKFIFFLSCSSLFLNAEKVDITSPEGWGMSYQAASSLNLSDGFIEALKLGDFRISAEVINILRVLLRNPAHVGHPKVGLAAHEARELLS